MSEEPKRYGYGKDLRIKFNADGEMDLVISPTGDLALVGGDGDDAESVRVEQALQQIKIRILTPFGSLKDENGIAITLGSNLLLAIGSKMRDESILLFKSFINSSLASLPFIEQINAIDLIVNRKDSPTAIKLRIGFTLKEDTKVYYTTIDLTESEV
jgi:hypothetical protein